MTMTATYSPEDNKLRLYATSRLDAELYARVKAAGFKWAPKQELFVAPKWTPAREDLLLELCGEIDDEDYSPEERAADRAERFGNYRDKRRAEAGCLADRFDSGPSAFGHQNRARAERQASRHDRLRVGAVSQWSKAEYWQARTAGVISHALYKSSAEVRRGRVLELQAQLRAIVAAYTPQEPASYIMQTAWHETEPSQHVWCGPKGRGGHWVKVANLEAIKAASARWVAHYELRLSYERAMLASEGGTAAEVEMEQGGWLGSHQIHKVNKSPITGLVVSVTLKMPGDRWGNSREGHHMRAFNIERLPEGAYRAPTDEERAAWSNKKATDKKAAKAASKANPKPPLINPTDEDAERLQAIWNAHAAKHQDKRPGASPIAPSTVLRMTQAQYAILSKGTYARCNTADITEQLKKRWQTAMGRDTCGRVTIFKVRRTSSGELRGADRVIVLTDKPRKAIPWEQAAEVAAEQPSEANMVPRLGELYRVCNMSHLPDKGTPEMALLDDGVYIGWVHILSWSQFGLTEAGWAAYRQHCEVPASV